MVQMPNVADVLTALDRIAPPRLAFPDDPIGLQIGRKSDPVSRCLVSLDSSVSAIGAAVNFGAQALIAHHAILYHPVRSLAGDSAQVQAIRMAIEKNIAVLIAHTNWDAAPGGVNDTLATMLSLQNVRPFGSDIPQSSFKLVTFLPAEHRDSVLDALSVIGCGVIGLYRRCAFFSPGRGTYEPQEGANPMIGQVGNREITDEERVEILVPGDVKQEAIRVLEETHPYDEPAFDLYPIEAEAWSLPRMGTLEEPMELATFEQRVSDILQTKARAFGKNKRIRTVGVVGGSGGGYWMKAKIAGCDALVTGEVRHHEAVEATESGVCLVEAGHYATEQPGMQSLAERLQTELRDVEFRLYTPDRGIVGHPW